LTPEDLAVTWKVMSEAGAKRCLAFYNCGPESGASQPHKHVQLIPSNTHREFYPPVMRLLARVSEQPAGRRKRCCGSYTPVLTRKTAGTIFRIPEYDFIHGCVLLDECRVSPSVPPSEAGSYLAAVYAALLGDMFDSVHSHRAALLRRDGDPEGGAADFPSFISYNLVFTQRFMLVVPRSREKGQGVSLNSVAYAGMVLLKQKEQMEQIAGFADILKELAFPMPRGADAEGCGGFGGGADR